MFCYSVFMMLVANAQTQPSTLQTKIDATSFMIGDQVQVYFLLKQNEEEAQITWPTIPETIAALEVLELSPIDTLKEPSGITYKQRITLTCFDSGSHLIPAFAFKVKPENGDAYTLYSDSLRLAVTTPNVDTSKPFISIKDIVPVESSWEDYIPQAVMVLGAVLLILCIRYLLKKRKKPIKALKKQETYSARALRLLQELANDKPWEQGLVKEFYTSLSDIIRSYIAQRFSINATEMTTEEINAIARKNPELRSYRKSIRDLLQMADMAKFAKAQPSTEEHLNALADAKRFVATTQPLASAETIPSNTP